MSLFHDLHALALSRAVSRKASKLKRELPEGTITLVPSAHLGGFTADATRAGLHKDGCAVSFTGPVGEFTRTDAGIRLGGADAAEFFDRGGLPTPAEGETAPPPATGDTPGGDTSETPRPRARRAG